MGHVSLKRIFRNISKEASTDNLRKFLGGITSSILTLEDIINDTNYIWKPPPQSFKIKNYFSVLSWLIPQALISRYVCVCVYAKSLQSCLTLRSYRL